MLTRFSVKNFRSFANKTTFDLITDKRYEFSENAVCGNFIRHAMLYGGNGEGKSNLGLAMTEITTHFNKFYLRDKGNDSTYLNADSLETLAEFEYVFVFNGIEVRYCFGKPRRDDVAYEHLWIDGKSVIHWNKLESSIAEISLLGTETLDKNLHANVGSVLMYIKLNSNLQDNTTNSAFLSLFEFVEKMVYIKVVNGSLNHFVMVNQQALDVEKQIIDEPESVKEFQQFLNDLDIPCQLAVVEDFNTKKLAFVHKNRKLDFFNTASSGTITLVYLFCLIKRIEEKSISFVYLDEFDAFYHQKLAKLITRKLSGFEAQTILSTHNTGIMSNDLLRPDCYFEIKAEKITPLYQLSDRELRKAHNLEKMYRSGAFDE